MSKNTFPAFLRVELADKSGFAEFERETAAAASRAERQINEALGDASRTAAEVGRALGTGMDEATRASARSADEIVRHFADARRAGQDFADGLTAAQYDLWKAWERTEEAAARAESRMMRMPSSMYQVSLAALEYEKTQASTAQTTQALDRALGRLEATYDRGAAATRKYEEALRSISSLEQQGAISAERAGQLRQAAAQALEEETRALEGHAGAVGQARLGYRSLSTQLGGFIREVAGGGNPLEAFTRRLNDTGSAVTRLSGSKQGLLAVLTGPWGLAFAAAAAATGALVTRLQQQRRAQQEAAQAAEEAIRELEQATRQEMQTSEQAERRRYDEARRAVEAAQAKREEARAILEVAQAKLAEAQARMMDPTLAGEGGFNPGSVAAQNYAQQLQNLQALIAEMTAGIASAEESMNRRLAPLLERRVDERMDDAAAATGRYERSLAGLREELVRGNIAQEEFERRLTEIRRRRDQEMEAVRQRRRGVRDEGDLTQFRSPLVGALTGRFGERRGGRAHAGIDIAAPVGSRVQAPAAGVVIEVGNDPGGYGTYMIVDHGRGTSSRYAHLSRIIAQKGSAVTAGQVIALTGGARGAPGSGNSTGPHLHYEVRRNGRAVNPIGQYPTDELATTERAAEMAARALQELERNLAALTSQFDPAEAAAQNYAATLERIAELQAADRLGPDEAERFRMGARAGWLEQVARIEEESRRQFISRLSPELQRVFRGDLSDLAQIATSGLVDAGTAGGEAFRNSGIEAVHAITEAFGREMRGTVDNVAAMLSGDFGRQGRFGRLISFFADANSLHLPATEIPGAGRLSAITIDSEFAAGLRSVFDPLRRTLDNLVTAIQNAFARNGSIAQLVGEMVGYGTLGAMGGRIVGGSSTLGAVGGVIGGVAGKALGKALGTSLGTLGSAMGPLGSIVGGMAGSLMGGLFKSTPRASSSIGIGPDGRLIVASTTGTKGLRDQSIGAAESAISTIERIAELLGATVLPGVGAVSIGMRKGNWMVDPSGMGITKEKRGAINFGQDAAAAVRAATLDLIKDGVLAGLRDSTHRLLQRGKDLDQAISKAVRFESVFTDLKRHLDPVGAAIDEVDKRFRSLVSIFNEAGASAAELADLEQLYAIEREAAAKQAGQAMTGALRALLDDLTVGNDARSLRERLTQAMETYSPLAAKLAAGEKVDFDEFADAARMVEQLTRQVHGSGSAYFAMADEIVRLTREALDRQEALIGGATGRPPLLGGADSTTPVVGAIDQLGNHLGGIMTDHLGGHLQAINDNMITLINLQMTTQQPRQAFPDRGGF